MARRKSNEITGDVVFMLGEWRRWLINNSDYRELYYPARTIEGKMRDGELPGISGQGCRPSPEMPQQVELIEKTILALRSQSPIHAEAIRRAWFFRDNREELARALHTNKSDVYKLLDVAEGKFMTLLFC